MHPVEQLPDNHRGGAAGGRDTGQPPYPVTVSKAGTAWLSDWYYYHPVSCSRTSKAIAMRGVLHRLHARSGHAAAAQGLRRTNPEGGGMQKQRRKLTYVRIAVRAPPVTDRRIMATRLMTLLASLLFNTYLFPSSTRRALYRL